MEKKHFNITIDAPREKVWQNLWGAESYGQWTAPFSPTSRAETDWKKGSKALFLDEKNSGMVAKIEENIPNEYMSIELIGEVIDGVEDTTSDRVKGWAGAHEIYKLRDANGKTDLEIELDLAQEFMEMMTATWPKALEKLKDLSEKN
jgi:uncharacterized protein YndB with AHSA1/START domain